MNCESPPGLYKSLYIVFGNRVGRGREIKSDTERRKLLFTFILPIAPSYPAELWVQVYSTHVSHLSASWLQSLQISCHTCTCTPPSPLLYLDMCFIVLSSGTAFHYPRYKLGCLPFGSKGIIFCTGLKSNHLPPYSLVSSQRELRERSYLCLALFP